MAFIAILFVALIVASGCATANLAPATLAPPLHARAVDAVAKTSIERGETVVWVLIQYEGARLNAFSAKLEPRWISPGLFQIGEARTVEAGATTVNRRG